MAAHKDLRESRDTRIPYGQAANFNINATRKKLEAELELSQELEQVRSSSWQVTTILETLLNDTQT